jgi:Uma2 family endonuclease
MYDVSWQAYEALLAWRGERSAPRMTYLEGELELMSPSIHHEIQKKRLARLLEAWAEERDIPLDGAGSWTIKRQDAERGAEPDECYVVDGDASKAEAPDIAIEVVWTRGGIDKLEVYRKLGVREVWIWSKGALRFHLRRGGKYVSAARSELLPTFDPAFLVSFMSDGTQSEAVKALRVALRRMRDQGTKADRRRKR